MPTQEEGEHHFIELGEDPEEFEDATNDVYLQHVMGSLLGDSSEKFGNSFRKNHPEPEALVDSAVYRDSDSYVAQARKKMTAREELEDLHEEFLARLMDDSSGDIQNDDSIR